MDWTRKMNPVTPADSFFTGGNGGNKVLTFIGSISFCSV